MTPKDDIAEFCGRASWDHHRKRQLKELGIDPEEIDDE
jgi:hypothetical protein